MKRILCVLVSMLFFAALSFAVVGCHKVEKRKHADAVKQEEQVLASDLHPCEVTGTRLTDEDCREAKKSLNQVKQGTAAISVPTWMLQGQTKSVTLAVGNAPPPKQPAKSQPESQHEPTSEPLAGSQPKPQPEPTSEPPSGSQPKFVQTPHEVALKAKGSKKLQVIDYYPFVGKRMSAELTGEGFDIKPLFSQSDQPIVDDAVATWDWEITARDYGKKKLIIKTTVVMINSRGKPEPLKPTTEYREVTVYIGAGGIFDVLKSLPDWLKVVAAILAGVTAVLGAWKSLKVLLGRSRKRGSK